MNKVLVIAPHPDDESIGCGGTLRLHSSRGDRVVAVFLTSGELGLKRLPREEAWRIREQEAHQAAKLLGLAELVFLRRSDWSVGDDVTGAADALRPILKREAPDLIYLPHPAEWHPDHQAALSVVRAALRRTGLRAPILRGYEVWTPLTEHDHVENITSVMRRKLRAIRAHQSQLAGEFDYERAVIGLNQFRGALAGKCAYAEVFQTARGLEPMSRPLRIAIFTGSFPVVSETFILRQITGLLDLGHEVDIYADSAPDSNSPTHPEVLEYRLHERTTYMGMPPETAPWEMAVWPLTGRTWPPGSATSTHNLTRVIRALPKLFRCLLVAPRLTCQVLKPSEYRYQAASLSALYRLAKLCAQPKRHDILHAHFGPVGNSFRFTKELWQAPLVVSFHGYDFSAAPLKEGAEMYAKLFQTADAVTINSEFTRGQVSKLGCPEAKLHKLPMALDLDEFAFRERMVKTGEPIRMLTVARLVKKKGHEFSIRAFASVRETHPDVHYAIVGDGPLRPNLEALVDQLGVRASVTFYGACDSAQVQRHIAESHIFVLASVSLDGDQEGQGLVLQEAQAAGLPVVATTHGAFPEGLVPEKSGFLVPEADAAALAERLNFLVEHPETWPAMGREGRAFVEERFDIRKLNRQLVELYERVIISA